MKKKSQASLEFLFAIGIVLFIFILILAFNLERKNEVRKLNDKIALQSECFKLSSSITSAYIAGEGFNLTTKIKYNATVFADDRIASFEYEGIHVYCSFPINSVTNSTTKNFEIIKGDINIQNINQTVVIKNV